MLFVIDKFAGAKNIIDELTLVKTIPVIRDYAQPDEAELMKEVVID